MTSLLNPWLWTTLLLIPVVLIWRAQVAKVRPSAFVSDEPLTPEQLGEVYHQNDVDDVACPVEPPECPDGDCR